MGFSLRWHLLPLAGTLLFSGLSYGEDMEEVYRLALQNDPQLAASLEQRQGAREGIPQSQAALLPQMGFAADHTWVKQHTLDKDAYGIDKYGLNLKLPLLHWENWIGLGLAEKQVRQADIAHTAQEQALIFRVAKAYLDILSAEETLHLSKAEESAMARQLETAQERLKVGEAVITDVHEAQAWRDLSAAKTIADANQLDSNRDILADILGKIPKSLKPLKAEIPLEKPNPDNVETWVESAKENNFSLQASRLAVTIAQDQLDQAHTGHYPTLDAVANHGYQDSGASPFWQGGTSKADSLMVQLNIPLYAGGMVTSRERQSLHAVNQRKQELEQTQRQVMRQSRDAFRAVVAGIAQIRAFRQSVKSAESALAATREGLAAGMRTNLDVLTSERDYYQAKRNHANARYQYVLGALQLKQATGALGEEDLKRINGWLQ